MTDLETRYRQLFRAYPAEHRARREDEMVSALLDASRPGQRWPAPREGAAIVVNGWRVRATSATEWRAGLSLASAAAVAFAAAIAGSVLGIALLPPFDASRAPAVHVYGPVALAALCLVTLVVSCLAGRCRVPLALGCVVLAAALIGGQELSGARRSVTVPLACLVLLAAAGAGRLRAWRIARVGALVTGLVAAGWLLVRTVHHFGLEHPALDGTWPWLDRWLYFPYAARLPETWWWVLVGLSLLAGLVRPRFAVAGALLCVPLLPLTSWSFGGTWVTERMLRLVVVLAVLLAAATVRSWASYRPAPRPSGPGEA